MFGWLSRIRDSLWAGYLVAPPACLLAWAGHIALFQAGATNTPFLPFFLALLLTAIAGGIGPGLLCIAIGEFIVFHHAGSFQPALPLVTDNPAATSALLAAALATLLLVNYGTNAAIELQETSQALRAINETLEKRVNQRSAALLEAEENLRQAQKMEAVGLLTGGIAHDFNNLLTGLMSSLERLQTRLTQAPPAELERHIAAARDAATRASNLTQRLLAFSRRQPLQPRAIDADQLIANMAELIGRTISPAIRLHIQPCPGLHLTLADPNQLEHALLNLCINASDAMPAGGSLRIATRNASLTQPQAAALDLPPGDYITLAVTDTGTGMPPEVLARAFDPFFTTKPFGQGTGLGLSMVYGFARQSGGHIDVASSPGTGTCVTLYLPRHHGLAAAQPAAASQAPSRAAGHGQHILLVDDEACIRLLAAEVLEEQGYVVHQAANAEGALHILRHSQPIDILITDLGLPGLSGGELAQACHAMHPELKILIITGYGDSAPPSPGAPGVLNKPFPMSVLAARVQQMLDA